MNLEICAISFIGEKIILLVVVMKDLRSKNLKKVSYGALDNMFLEINRISNTRLQNMVTRKWQIFHLILLLDAVKG